MLGYLPAYYATDFGRKHWGSVGALLLGIPVTIVVIITLFVLFGPTLGIIELVTAVIGCVFGYFGVHGLAARRFKKNTIAVQTAAQLDPAWDEANLRQVVRDTFLSYQEDWTKLDYMAVGSYTTPEYAHHAGLMMAALAQLGRINNVADVQIITQEFSQISDNGDDSQDSFVAYIVAKANDQLIDKRTGQTLFTDKSEFAEYWKFVRGGGGWWLSAITPDTAATHRDARAIAIESFAGINDLYYSLDWGWLLLPKVGDIFSSGEFGKADINNHCIGTYHDILVQLYSYIPKRDNKGNAVAQYVVAQVAVPNKNYGRIIIRRKPTLGFIARPFTELFRRAPKGTTQITTESPDFNKMYNLYSAGFEGPTSFELLHPVYIEKMQALAFKVNIEVYDNTVFLYSDDPKADYAQMFELLKAAFEELKL